MEQGLREALFRDARAMVEALLNDRTLIADNEPPRPLETVYHERCCQVRTFFGVIRLQRRYYYHTRAHSGRCPLDHALDLVRGHTPAVARLICRASTQSASYRDAEEDLRVYAGLELESRNFGRLIAEIAPQMRQAQASLPMASIRQPIPILYLASDGTGVPLRRGELLGVKGRQADGSARTREAKLGCVFTQTVTDAEGNALRDPDSTTYVATFEDCRELGSLLRAEALRRGYASAPTTVYLGDGAAWIWENARLNFRDAVQILDFYHASEHAGELAAALLGAGPSAKEQQHRWCHEMKADSTAPIIEAATGLLEQRRAELSAQQIEVVAREIAYFTANAQRTHYGEFQQKGYFIGSGVVEAGCKTVVGRRLKQSGMFWSHRGGDDLLTLRCMTLGPNFPRIWRARHAILQAQRSKPPKWTSSLN